MVSRCHFDIDASEVDTVGDWTADFEDFGHFFTVQLELLVEVIFGNGLPSWILFTFLIIRCNIN